jgi:hypothetical protein
MSLKDRLSRTQPALAPTVAPQSAQPILPPDAPRVEIPAPPSVAPSVTPEPKRGDVSTTFPPGVDALFLYVDAMPTKGVSVDVRLEEEIHARVEKILKEHNATSIDLAPLDYGKGRALLAASFRANPPRGVVVARTGGLSTGVIEVLAAIADTVTSRIA